jgi:hypothetical protein
VFSDSTIIYLADAKENVKKPISVFIKALKCIKYIDINLTKCVQL